jgi:hypothetical protein
MVFFTCKYCTYFSDRKYNLQKHIDRKHSQINENNELSKNVQNVTPNVQNVIPNVQNVIPNVQNVIPNVQNVIPNSLSCSKCNKIYKTARHLYNHEKVCNKVDSLTCPRCMISFTNRHNKNRHIKADKCKARSIIHARTPNIQNITNNIHNNIQNNNCVTNNNQIIINNFGSERIDHISHEEIVKILSSGINTLPLYIKKKHFDKCFPENRNIKYTMENKCKVFEDNSWKDKDLGLLSSTLVQDNTEVLLLYCDDKDEKVLNTIQDIDKYENIKNKLFILYNKTDNIKYNTIITKIKDLIKNCELEEI